MVEIAIVNPSPPIFDWDFLRERVQDCPWSPAARAAGLWAIDVLREELGPRWPQAWQETGDAPAELAACWYSLAGLVGTLDLALALRRVRDIPGARAIRDTIRSTGRYDALMSPRLQIRIASLALAASVEVQIEPTLPATRAPADLLLSGAGVSCVVELAAVMRDAKTLDADRWLDMITQELTRIGQLHRIDFRGRMQEPLDEQLTGELLLELERRAAATAAGLELPAVQVGSVLVAASPATGDGGALSFELPTISYDRRIGGKLRGKARQTLRSGANWLLVDWMDHLWHMTAWGARPLAEKARDVAVLLREQLHHERHIRGVVLTDGAVLMRPGVPEQTAELPGGVVAMSRQIDKWHTRESIIVPLGTDALDATRLWFEILDAEHGWMARELDAVGLDRPKEFVETVTALSP